MDLRIPVFFYMFSLVILLNLDGNYSLSSNEGNETESSSVTEGTKTTIQSNNPIKHDTSTTVDNHDTATDAKKHDTSAAVDNHDTTTAAKKHDTSTTVDNHDTATATKKHNISAAATADNDDDDDDDDEDDDDDNDDDVNSSNVTKRYDQELITPKKISKLGESEDTLPPKYRFTNKSDHNKIKSKKK
ncbi:unnamed protein product [Schistosoma spindalis]|nr:unnamed protein product [Schistosoma spindale]